MKTMNLLPTFYTQHLKTQLKRAEFLILFMLVALLQQHRRVKLEELANQFPQKILFESRRKKLQRFLSLPQLTVEKIWWPLLSYWLTNNFEPTSVLYIAIDRTQWANVNLIFVSLIYDKRAIPIYFEVLPKLGNTNVDKQIDVLSKVLPLLNNYTTALMSGEKIKNKRVVKYVGRVKEKSRTQRRHSSFYIGMHGYAWVESLTLLTEQTAQLMSLSPHKRPDYQRGRRAEKLIRSTF